MGVGAFPVGPGVAVGVFRAQVEQQGLVLVFQQAADGIGIGVVVQVADHEQVGVGILLEDGADVVGQQAGLVAAHFGLAVFMEDLGLQVRDQQVQAVAGIDVDVGLDEAAPDGELAGPDGEGVVGVEPAGGDREAGEQGEVAVLRILAEVFRVRIVEAGGAQAGLEIGPGGGIAHFLQGEDVGRGLPDGGDDGRGLAGRLGLERVGVAVAVGQGVLVQVEGHDREAAGASGRRGGGGGAGRAAAGGEEDEKEENGGRGGGLHGRLTSSGRRLRCAGKYRGT